MDADNPDDRLTEDDQAEKSRVVFPIWYMPLFAVLFFITAYFSFMTSPFLFLGIVLLWSVMLLVLLRICIPLVVQLFLLFGMGLFVGALIVFYPADSSLGGEASPTPTQSVNGIPSETSTPEPSASAVVESPSASSSISARNTLIYVEGENGVLTEGGSYSYLGESARGEEAYLGDGGAVATYTVSSALAGEYELSVRLTDDGLHPDGSRSVSVTAGETSVTYTHVSEDTDGWKWYLLGSVYLQQGENTIAFTKDMTTSAAYVMDAFRLTPVSE